MKQLDLFNQKEIEIWKPVPEFEGFYEVSNLGRIKSIDRTINSTKYKEKILKISYKNKGYAHVDLTKHCKKKARRIHILVMLAFVGKHSIYTEINHIDSNKANNKLENLEWCDHRHNMKHSWNGRKKSSKFFGLCWNEKYQKWEVYINEKNVKYNLGYYADEDFANQIRELYFDKIINAESIAIGKLIAKEAREKYKK